MKNALTLVSALLAAFAFIKPVWCAELIFIFFIPLFYAVQKYCFLISFKEGYLWGMIFYAIFFFDLFRVIIYKGQGWARGLGILFLLIYASSTSALWFGLSQKLSSFFSQRFMLLLIWTGITCLYFYWIDSAFFWVFGKFEGNQLNHLIVPLAIRPEWLSLMPFFGKNYLASIIIMSSMLIVMLITESRHFTQKIALTLLMVCCYLPFIIGWFPGKSNDDFPSWIENIGCIVPKLDSQNPWDSAEHIMFLLDDFQKKHPKIHCILMPESSFKFPLNRLQRCIQLWETAGKSLIVGSHRKEGGQLFNTLYLIKNSVIIDYYDKQHTLFFTERIPQGWGYFLAIKNLFLKDHEIFSPSTKEKKYLVLEYLGIVTPSICSDIFFMTEGILKKNELMVSIINDSWFISGYIPCLMYLQAKVIALLYQCSIIYVGYHYCVYINPNGKHYFLTKLVG